MKYLIVLVFFLFSLVKLNIAQDLIVLNTGDSLNCMITSVDNKYVYFAYKNENGNLMSTALPKTKIKDFKREYYGKIQSDEPKNQYFKNPSSQTIKLFENPKVIICAHGGLSYLIAKLPENLPSGFDEYYRNLKWGIHWGADLKVFLNKKLGIGFKHTVFTTTNSINVMVVDTTTGQTLYGILKDEIKVKFYGPTFFITSTSPTGRWVFMASVSIGYLDYKNHFTLIDKYLLTGNTIGVCYDLNIDLRLDKNLAISAGISMLEGSLSQMIMDDGVSRQTINFDEGEEEGLSRFDFSVGLKWYLN